MSTAVRYQYMPPLSPETCYRAWGEALMLDLSPAPNRRWHVTLVRGNLMEQTKRPVLLEDVSETIARLGISQHLKFKPWGSSELPSPPFAEWSA